MEVDKVNTKEKFRGLTLNNSTNKPPTILIYSYKLKIEVIALGYTLYLANYIHSTDQYNLITISSNTI